MKKEDNRSRRIFGIVYSEEEAIMIFVCVCSHSEKLVELVCRDAETDNQTPNAMHTTLEHRNIGTTC